jgi:hypothetical protein
MVASDPDTEPDSRLTHAVLLALVQIFRSKGVSKI